MDLPELLRKLSAMSPAQIQVLERAVAEPPKPTPAAGLGAITGELASIEKRLNSISIEDTDARRPLEIRFLRLSQQYKEATGQPVMFHSGRYGR